MVTRQTSTHRITALRKKNPCRRMEKGSWGGRLLTDTQQKSHCYPGREKVPPLETAELCSQSLVRGADLRPESVHSLFINKVLFEPSHTHLAKYCCWWFHSVAPELEGWDRGCGALNLKGWLSGSQGKMSAILVLEKGDKDNKACEARGVVGGWMGGSAVEQEEKGGHKGG